MKLIYPAVFKPFSDQSGGYVVEFPDLPGCVTEGKNLEAGFNPKYFLDALKVIDDEEIFIDFGSSISPSVIRSVDEGDYTYMILPIRLKE